jgi:hypothetical protein
MKNKINHASRLITICFFFFSLSSPSILASGDSDSTNLIQNSSFETNNQPTLQSWITDTSLAQAIQDAPPFGGKWSLQLVPGWIPQEGFARTYISGQSGVGVYQLTFWSKSTYNWQGSVTLGQWTQKGWIQSKMIYCDSAIWTQYSLTDTLSLQAGDTIGVHLSAGRVEVARGQVVLFDLIDLEKIASITKVESKYNQFPTHFALNQNYPNPFNPTTVINYQIPINGFVLLKVFDLLGHKISTLVNEQQKAGNHSVNFDAIKLTSGIYFYSLQFDKYAATKKMLLIK